MMLADTPPSPAPVRAENVSIPARDGLPLAATLYEGSRSNGVAVQVNPGTSVPRRYYDAFSRYLAGRGFTVVTYDYRGMGDTRMEPAALRKARFQDWGELDAPGVQDWLAARQPSHRLAVVGHSAGGQMLGLADNASRFRAVLLIASPHGWWRNWSRLPALQLAFVWYVLTPVSLATVGYFPGKLVGMGNLPPGIASQWARWCRNPHYVSDESGGPLRPYNEHLRAPLRLYSFTDDEYAPERSVRALLEYYPRAPREHLRLTPAQLGLERIGHFGWFRSSMPRAAWDEAADWLEQTALRLDGPG
ncbi:alpha/beta fold hydrolase [Myxococcus sp. RHSTA-1-4]|uniref:alpha/beta hydrolase family protein n=1 Tax=Myxococcus sp. RHSTA-1-4 TaxID=2874601 RepID=UPI001CC1617D|nr:alpha/beta fold hydrolase [Myxococcus sp. RHSTA-1-4]MBZ4416926.1 alpha/beta fold hydrolase [Myxococcus sp. RHSTA-1-4]